MSSRPEQHFRNDANSQAEANWLHVKVREMLFTKTYVVFFSSGVVGYFDKDRGWK